MINCLTDYVTLSRKCSPTTPISGIYLDSIRPEISIKKFEQLTNQEARSVEELYTGDPNDANDTGIYGRAVLRLETDTRNKMLGKFTRRNVIESALSHEYDEPFTLTTPAAEYRGVYIESKASPYTDIYINHVHIYLNAPGSIPILIYDANTGILLDTISFTGIRGYNRIGVNKCYSTEGRTRRLFVCYDATAITSAETKYLDQWGGSDCACECDGDPWEYMEVRGAFMAIGPSPIEDNITKQTDSGGLIVSVNLVCSAGALICQNVEAFKMAFILALTIEFLQEAAQNDRINQFTVFMDRTAIDNHLYGTENKVGLFDQYATLLNNFLEDFHPNDHLCFECDDMVLIHQTIP